jgi:2-methylcitrate dehydratase
MSWDTVVAKFNSIASPYASDIQCGAIVDAVAHLEKNGIKHLAGTLNESFVGHLSHA